MYNLYIGLDESNQGGVMIVIYIILAGIFIAIVAYQLKLHFDEQKYAYILCCKHTSSSRYLFDNNPISTNVFWWGFRWEESVDPSVPWSDEKPKQAATKTLENKEYGNLDPSGVNQGMF